MIPDCAGLEESEAALHEEDDDGDDDQEELVAGQITDQYWSEWTNQRSVLRSQQPIRDQYSPGLGAHGSRRLALGPQPLQLVLTRGRS